MNVRGALCSRKTYAFIRVSPSLNAAGGWCTVPTMKWTISETCHCKETSAAAHTCKDTHSSWVWVKCTHNTRIKYRVSYCEVLSVGLNLIFTFFMGWWDERLRIQYHLIHYYMLQYIMIQDFRYMTYVIIVQQSRNSLITDSLQDSHIMIFFNSEILGSKWL